MRDDERLRFRESVVSFIHHIHLTKIPIVHKLWEAVVVYFVTKKENERIYNKKETI